MNSDEKLSLRCDPLNFFFVHINIRQFIDSYTHFVLTAHLNLAHLLSLIVHPNKTAKGNIPGLILRPDAPKGCINDKKKYQFPLISTSAFCQGRDESGGLGKIN